MDRANPAQLELVLGMTLDGAQAVVLSGTEVAKHKLMVGITGMGKSKLLASLFVQLMNQGVGVCLLDPAGDLADDVLVLLIEAGYFADARAFSRLLYLDFTRSDAYVPMNVLAQPYPPHKIASSVLEAFSRVWPDVASGSAPVLANYVQYGSLVLAANSEPLTALPQLLTDAAYRAQLVRRVDDVAVRDFFARMEAAPRHSSTLVESTLRRVNLLSFAPALRYSLGQRGNRLQMRALMDQGTSVLINLGGLEAETQRFLGALLSIAVEEAALSRADLPEAHRRPFHYLMDEFSQFSARSAASLERVLALTRKYGLSLLLACQTLGQVPRELHSALQNTTLITFRLGADDADWAAARIGTYDPERVKYTASGHAVFMSAHEQMAEVAREIASLPPRRAILRVAQQSIALRTLAVAGPAGGRAGLASIKGVKDRYAAELLTPVRALRERPAPAQGGRQAPRAPEASDRVQRRVPLEERE